VSAFNSICRRRSVIRPINPLSHRERAGERGSNKQALLLDSYPLFLAFSRREKESFF
jgi:hypothetical protein